MKTLAISDLHFGAWTGDDLLHDPFALEALGSRLEDVDEVVLLGDLFDFLFSTVEDAFAAADPFFELLRRQMQRGRVVFLAGNHDHHLMVRALEGIVEERLATGRSGAEAASPPGFFERFLERRLQGVETAVVYPSYVENAWPGTGVLIDSERGEPELVRMLEDLNPLARARRGERALDGLGEAAHRYERELREYAGRA